MIVHVNEPFYFEAPFMSIRLISFLGTGNYENACYRWNNESYSSKYVVFAIAKMLQNIESQKNIEVVLLATDKAWQAHGQSVCDTFAQADLPTPQRRTIPDGASQDELWNQFEIILDVLQSSDDVVYIDITHGFRAQPFFASGVIQYLQSVFNRSEDVHVIYGEYNRNQPENSRIWDLTPFVELSEWSRSLLLFLKTGQAQGVVEPTRKIGRDLKKKWAAEGRQGQPTDLDQLAKLLEKFSDDFITVRTGCLLLGPESSSQQLVNMMEKARDEVIQILPPLGKVVDMVIERLKPLCGATCLSDPQGQAALQYLSMLYFKMGRIAEACATLREGWITKYADSRSDKPGTVDFDKDAREEAEKRFFERHENLGKQISQLRNDIQHAGYRKDPMPPKTIINQFLQLHSQWVRETQSTLTQS
ncbi:TM1812 family CRISPR-associated protein [Isosphaera pallida]|nr:TM1812 family CRISPR-associated protein [Isosphaera pallida]